MKNSCLFILCLFFIQCKAQSPPSLGAKSAIAVADIKKTVVCKSEKFTYHFPDIYGKNENNFFNQEIIADYIQALGTDVGKVKTPEELLQNIVKARTEGCKKKDNYSGLNAVSFETGINNGKILSLTMHYEMLAGNLNIEEKYYNFDIVNKKLLTANEVFRQDKIPNLVARINKTLKEQLEEYNKENKDQEQQEIVDQLLANSTNIFPKEQLKSFKILEKGIEFKVDYGVPRGTIPLDNDIFMTYEELEGYLMINK